MCTLCSGTYTLLPTLVSHIRAAHSHEQRLCFSCGINNCPKTFKNTNTYYKHIRNNHYEKYIENNYSTTKKQPQTKTVTVNDDNGTDTQEMDISTTLVYIYVDHDNHHNDDQIAQFEPSDTEKISW